ncbi:hypothetical protein L798_02623 [Zootermopsis nevadensis]|uniref:Uncharacterized protein n=1 Tax=Zootermopsis nevadensis TaxID=136037 RepID=A0A067RD63_ZOONE|nr:hypothetical protein L798_02623 [Zootermopsis nevadensis]
MMDEANQFLGLLRTDSLSKSSSGSRRPHNGSRIVGKSSKDAKTNGHSERWCHTSRRAIQTEASLGSNALHLPYSSDLTPSDRALFDKMDSTACCAPSQALKMAQI